MKYDLTTIVPDMEYVAEFVPLSKSRNAGEKQPSLNWRCTFTRSRATLTTDYMQGIGHLPGYKQGVQTIHKDDAERAAAESGRWNGYDSTPVKRLPPPDAADVMYSLLADAEALEWPTFEEWAQDNDSDPDSRAAEKIYRACIEIGLKLRALIGDAKMNELREYLRDL